MRVALYARYSSDHQASGQSLVSTHSPARFAKPAAGLSFEHLMMRRFQAQLASPAGPGFRR